MAKSADFNPPSPNAPGKPYVKPWDAPPITQEKERFAELHSIDLSQMDSDDPKVVQDLVDTVKYAIRTDGFLFLENYGVSLEQLHRQFALAQYLYEHISEEDKERLLFDPDSGKWSGYKHPFGFKVSLIILWRLGLNSRRNTRVSPTASNSSTGTLGNGPTTRDCQSVSCRSWTRSGPSARCVDSRSTTRAPILISST